MNQCKIIIVDDHLLFREGMKLLIEEEGMGKVIAEAENGEIFLELLDKYDPDLVLMDIEMPIMNGLEATIRAKMKRPEIKILIITMLSENENYTDLINAGAMGFVLKTSSKEELDRAIKMVTSGECYFSNNLLRQIIFNRGKMINDNGYSKIHNEEFTDRELEVMQYFCEGFTANEIALKLFRSIKTIEAYRSKLLEKTRTKNTINLVLYAIKNKLVEI
ncbi:MAG: response regulator transcription factor [Paludibacter sp.]